MPEEFDPAWEYWEPDPEVVEAMTDHEIGGLAIDFTEDDHGRLVPAGFRFGRGNPDFVRFRLAPPKPERETVYVPPRHCDECGVWFQPRLTRTRFCCRECSASWHRLDPRACLACGSVFRPHKSSNVYCSRDCVPHPGGERVLPDRNCRHCGKLFRPLASRTIYCSVRCVRHPGAPRRLADRPCMGCARLFAPDRDSRRYCSDSCYVRPGRRKPVSFEELPVKLEDAMEMARRGVRFGDLYPNLAEEDREPFRQWWICDTEVGAAIMERDKPEVPRDNQPLREISGRAFKESGYTGDICQNCGGSRMTRAGSCLCCEDCGTTSGCG